MTRDPQVLVDDHPAPHGLRAQRPGERAGGHPGCPHHGAGRDLGSVRQPSTIRGDLLDTDAEPDLDTEPLQFGASVLARRRLEAAEQSIGGFDEHDLGVTDGKLGEVVGEHPVVQLGQTARHLDPGRASPTHHHVEASGLGLRRIERRPLELVEEV
ncbi:MAG: hypothetical protein R2705_23680 [Ilumatobacteraceae bacterium]